MQKSLRPPPLQRQPSGLDVKRCSCCSRKKQVFSKQGLQSMLRHLLWGR